MTKPILTILIIVLSLFNISCEINQKMEALKVVGIIKDKTLVEVPNKAIGKPSRKETRITLEILEVNGVETGQLDYPVFAATEEILSSFSPGQKVRVVCTSSSGRQIQEISLVAE